MNFNVNSNLSALSAFGTKMAVTANNVANVETEGFKKSRAILNEGAHQGVKVDIEQVDTPGPVVSVMEGDQLVERELSNVDLAEEITGMIPTQRGFEANIKVVQTEDEMLGSVMDLIA